MTSAKTISLSKVMFRFQVDMLLRGHHPAHRIALLAALAKQCLALVACVKSHCGGIYLYCHLRTWPAHAVSVLFFPEQVAQELRGMDPGHENTRW